MKSKRRSLLDEGDELLAKEKEFPRIAFGSLWAEKVDWRKIPEVVDDEDPDDEELEKTPEDVIRMLGFDPKELSDEEEEEK